MSLDLIDYKIKAHSAVKMFWISRKKAGKKRSAGNKDQGKRSAGTSGSYMDGFIDLVIEIVHANGLTDADIMRKGRGLTLPGHFCPIKSWDLIVMNNGKLIAAIKFDAQVGPLFGKNADSCCEHAISLGVDFRAVFRRGTFGEHTKPFVGYLGLLEDSPASRAPVKDIALNFPLVPEYRNASYAKRYDILCKKLTAEWLYTSATVILSPRTASKSGEYSEMSDITGFKSFVATLAGHIATEAAM
jgi:hypothetical protein